MFLETAGGGRSSLESELEVVGGSLRGEGCNSASPALRTGSPVAPPPQQLLMGAEEAAQPSW